MPLVYIVDDEPHIRRLASIGLKDAGFETAEFADGTSLLRAIGRQIPDAVLLDWMMPGTDGLTVLHQLRTNASTRPVPILMMTARSDEADRVQGLEGGADDYITKPFSVRELAARVRAVIRRQEYLTSSQEQVLEQGGLSLDYARRQVTKNGQPVELAQKEFELLYTLMKAPGRVFTREMLMNRVWKADFYSDMRTVDVHIRYLRQKLEDEPDNPRLILTVRGAGYRFRE
ncbi:MAG: response regulator transcription factor [Clostridiales bacterium]|nr:response regulator transcription factor [Clostridiales bacterium]